MQGPPGLRAQLMAAVTRMRGGIGLAAQALSGDPKARADLEFLIVGGGGGGAFGEGGGGGGGGVLQGRITLFAGLYRVRIGAGGLGGTPGASATDGGDSSIDGIGLAPGGGGGGDRVRPVGGRRGGSGGAGDQVGQLSGSGIRPFGYPGATFGGGGGFGSPGALSAFLGGTGNGGAGLNSSITGSILNFAAGGGGGGNDDPITPYAPGAAGGASATAGGLGTVIPAAPANRGGGGGAGGIDSAGNGTDGGAGGSGVAYARYLTGTVRCIGGTITTVGLFTLHTFTAGDNFVVLA
jgi:hypothetical protein